MSESIGDYYDRKRREGNEAWHRYLEHRAHCTECRELLHCREATKLKTRAIDAGNTGD
jgi:hypothetical protein